MRGILLACQILPSSTEVVSETTRVVGVCRVGGLTVVPKLPRQLVSLER